jgi:hypothetical protein
MNTKFTLKSLKTGRSYRLRAEDISNFYSDHILGWPRKLLRGCGISAIGTVLLQLNRNGELIEVRAGGNLVVTTGLNAVIDRLQAATPAVHDYQAIGTGTNASALGDTTLQTELVRAQGALSQPIATTDRLVTTFAAGTGTGALTETGRLNAAAAGNLFARQVFSVINKGASDSLTITHDITVS